MNKKTQKLMRGLTTVLTVVFFLVIYQTHRAVVFTMDDKWYSTKLYDTAPITGLWDIVKSQIWHYNNWGGRSIAHGILQLTLMAGQWAADLLNVAVTVLLGVLMCRVAGQRGLWAFLAALSMVLGLNADWRMTMFWQSGAANYLYTTVFVLGFVHCYLRQVPDEGSFLPWKGGRSKGEGAEKDEPSALPGITLWILPLGLAAGWSNENMGPGVWVLSGAVMALVWREGRKIRPWMVLGNLACLAGSVLCIVAPGNAVRSSLVESRKYGFLWQLFLRCYGEAKGALDYLFPTLLVLGALFMMCVCVGKQAVGRRSVLLCACALLSWGAFLLAPHYPARAAFGTMVLCICAALSLARRVLDRCGRLAWPFWWGTVLIWLRGMYFCGEYLAVLWGWIR